MPVLSVTESTISMAMQNKSDDSFNKRFNEIIEANLSNKKFGVSNQANKMNMNRINLYRRIKSTKGISVSLFLRNTKLDKAFEI